MLTDLLLVGAIVAGILCALANPPATILWAVISISLTVLAFANTRRERDQEDDFGNS